MNKLIFVVSVLFCVGTPIRGQEELPLVAKVEHAIKNGEPGWRYSRGICTCPPLIPGQKRVVVTVWERKGNIGKRGSVDIDFYEVESSVEAAEWMTHFDRGEVAQGWQVSKYELGDDAYLCQFEDGKRYSLYFRKGPIVVEVSGESLSGVERFAKHIAVEMIVTQ